MESADASAFEEEAPKHIKAMRIHRGIAIFYCIIFIVLLLDAASKGHSISSAGFIFVAIFVGFHALIAYGAKTARRWAGALSIVFAFLILLAVPIGTLVGYYLLKNADWVRSSE